jgi:hypothetical protein
MDSAWFAVDRNGHVAVFETGEAGAVPQRSYLGEDYLQKLDELREKLTRGGAIHDLEGHRAFAQEAHVTVTDRTHSSAMMFLRSMDMLRGLRSRMRAREVATTLGVGLRIRECDPEVFRQIHERNECLGCFPDNESEDSPDIGEFGLFHYEHTTENWISGPYVRSSQPDAPVSASDLDPQLVASAAVFDGTFGESRDIQPAERWVCASWESAWLALDRRTVRPFAGKEREYAAQRAELAASLPSDFVFLDEPLPLPIIAPKKPWWKIW